MTATAVRVLARKDIEDAVDHYRDEAGETVAFRFVEALERALQQLKHHPESGSPLHGHELGLQASRGWPLRRFPQLIFYVVPGDRVDVWRVLHGARDMAACLAATEDP